MRVRRRNGLTVPYSNTAPISARSIGTTTSAAQKLRRADTEYECGDEHPVPADWIGDGHDSCGYVVGNEWTITTNTEPLTKNFTFGDPGDTPLTWR